MVAAGQLRHHPTIGRMQVDLAVQGLRQKPALAVIQRHAGLVTARFDAQYPHALS